MVVKPGLPATNKFELLQKRRKILIVTILRFTARFPTFSFAGVCLWSRVWLVVCCYSNNSNCPNIQQLNSFSTFSVLLSERSAEVRVALKIAASGWLQPVINQLEWRGGSRDQQIWFISQIHCRNFLSRPWQPEDASNIWRILLVKDFVVHSFYLKWFQFVMFSDLTPWSWSTRPWTRTMPGSWCWWSTWARSCPVSGPPSLTVTPPSSSVSLTLRL